MSYLVHRKGKNGWELIESFTQIPKKYRSNFELLISIGQLCLVCGDMMYELKY